MNVTESSPDICALGGKGLFLPAFGDDEQGWPRGLRIVLYAIGLGWLFMGVGGASDVFMGAIEKITSKKVRKFNAKLGRWMTAEVWNPTVANLTLMALGSSAPEILLSCIELFSNEMYSGELGPSTIVGSAAFNLLCITAVCIIAIPDGEVRKIKELSVFAITAFFSIFAYLWLLIILLGPSPNVVEPWEGIVTFLFFPILVILAYMADRGYPPFSKPAEMGSGVVVSSEMSKEELAELDLKIRQKYGKDLTSEQVSKIALIENGGKKTRAQYRVAATRGLMGGKRVKTESTQSMLKRKFTGMLGEKLRVEHERRNSLGEGKVMPEDETVERPKAVIEFGNPTYATLENAGTLKCTVMRSGDENLKCSVKYSTRDGTAKAVEDYIHKQGQVDFAPGETQKDIEITIIDNESFEQDEDFYIDLYDPECITFKDEQCVLGESKTATITIIDDDLPGMLSFPKDDLHITEEIEDWEVDVLVERKNGCTGRIECKYRTESIGAIAGQDFDELDGTLVFENQVKQARIKLCLKARGRYDRTEDFRIILTDISGGATFDPNTDGGNDTDILTVFIESEAAAKDRVDRLMSALKVNWNKSKVGHANWLEQFKEAISVNGGGDDDDGDEDSGPPSIMDYVMHVITLPWKLLCACVPPVDYCGGWVCFVCSLLLIGIVTAFINDMASLLGCVLSLGNEVTAITFVALGTSLPDTFASMSAAKGDPYADASIGNVTGSNSVNVFLGLGLPWTIGAIFWSGQGTAEWTRKHEQFFASGEIEARHAGGAFVVMAGSLSFSVAVFCGCAFACLVAIYARRMMFGGELGGPKVPKYVSACFMVGLWFLYIGLSTWKSLSSKP